MAMLTENFDSYSAGELNGTGSWSAPDGNDLFAITTTQAQSSPNSVTLGSTIPGNNVIGKALASTQTSGIQVFYVYVASLAASTDAFGVYMYSSAPVSNPGTGAVTRFQVYRNGSNYDFRLFDSGVGFTTISSSISTSTWYKIAVRFDTGTDLYAASINGGAYSSDVNMTASSGVTHVGIWISTEVGTNTFYVDSFSDGSPVVVNSGFFNFMPN